MTMQQKSLKNIGQTCTENEISENVESTILSKSMSSAEVSHAAISVLLEIWLGSMEKRADFGEKCIGSLANCTQGFVALKTCQLSFIEESTEFLATFPDSGTMRNGTLYQRLALGHIINVIEFSSLPTVPTPTASDGKGGHTPNANRGAMHNLRDWFVVYYNLLYPPVTVVEYLMGFPIGWTDLEDSETQ